MIKNIFDSVDAVGASFVQNAFGQLAASLATPLKAMLIIYVAAYGYAAMKGARAFNVNDAFLRAVRIVFIVMMVTKWDTYSLFVVEVATKAPDQIGSVITKGLGGDSAALSTNLGKFNDAIWTLVSQINAQGSMLSPSTAVLAALVALVGMVFVGVAAAMLMYAKLGLWIVLAIGPLFVVLMLYEWSARFAMGWLNTVVSMMVAMVLVYGIGGFILHISEKAVAAAAATQNSGGSVADLSLIAPILITAVIGALLLTQVPMLASALAGGGHFNSWMVGGAVLRGGRAVGGAAGRAASGVAAGGIEVVRARRQARLQETMNNRVERAQAR